MTDVIDLNLRRPPVVYTINIAHHYDGTVEFEIKDVADDPRSRDAVIHAFKRISGAEEHIEALEQALKHYACDCIAPNCEAGDNESIMCGLAARTALGEKKDG